LNWRIARSPVDGEGRQRAGLEHPGEVLGVAGERQLVHLALHPLGPQPGVHEA
jgi:hypothetical protein